MRASRLITLLLLIRTHGHLSATALATALGVSSRTVLRDLGALRTAGVPLTITRRRNGTMVSLAPAAIVAAGAMPDEPATTTPGAPAHAAAAIGLGLLLHQTTPDMLNTLPAVAQAHANRARARFLLDDPGWDDATAHAPFLPELSQAVWESTIVRLRYQQGNREATLVIEPLGLVLARSHWHLVGRDMIDNVIRPVRLARVLHVVDTGDAFARPDGFDLGAHWRTARGALAPELFRAEAEVRLSARGLAAAARLLEPLPAHVVRTTASLPDARGWRTAVFPIVSLDDAVAQCLRFGPEIEVLNPPALRAAMRRTAEQIMALYAPPLDLPRPDRSADASRGDRRSAR